MIAGCMIRHKIQDQPHASLVQSGAQAEYALQAPKLFRDSIIPHGIWGTEAIVEGKVVEGRLQRHDRGRILSHHPSTVQTGLPHPHEPDSVDLPAPPEVNVRLGYSRQRGFRNRPSRHELCKPDTRIDFVNTPIGHEVSSFTEKTCSLVDLLQPDPLRSATEVEHQRLYRLCPRAAYALAYRDSLTLGTYACSWFRL